MNIMTYLREHRPEVYAKAQYHIIEISPKLAEKQNQTRAEALHAADKIVVHNKSILQWQEITNDPCFVVGTEVLVRHFPPSPSFFFFLHRP